MGYELKDISLKGADKKYNLRQILLEDYKTLGELPIKGGWGYSMEDAIIIDKNDSVVNQNMPFDGVGIEYIIAEKRIYEELIVFRQLDQRFSGIKWNLKKQNTFSNEGKNYDHLIFEVSCFTDEHWELLRNEYFNGKNDPDFNFREHDEKRNELEAQYETEYYFDITSFF